MSEKPELTLELKARFFASYYGQNVLNGDYKLYYNSFKTLNKRSFLLLNRFGNKQLYPYHLLPTSESDIIRSKGYALPWNGISVDEQIEAGWVKIRQN